MASATPRTKKVTREVTTTVEETVPDGVTLHLTQAEAETLVAVYWRTGGSPFYSRRGHIQAIGEELQKAGISNPEVDGRSTVAQGLRFDATDDPAALDGLRADPF